MSGGLVSLFLRIDYDERIKVYSPEKLDEKNVFSDNEILILFFNIKFYVSDMKYKKIFYLNNLNTFFNCFNNDIMSIDLYKTDLIKINCSKNKIQNLGKMSEHLEWLDRNKNNLKEICIESNKLVLLNCSYNNISNLNNLPTSLKYLISTNNQIT